MRKTKESNSSGVRSSSTNDYPAYLPNLEICGDPNCDTVSDEDLKETFHQGRWDYRNPIPYSFSVFPFWKNFWLNANLIIKGVVPTRLTDDPYGHSVRNNTRTFFKKWTEASNGLLRFEEIDGDIKNGLSIFPIPESKIKAISGKEETFAFSKVRLDNSGYISQAFVYLPSEQSYWGVGPNPDLLPYGQGTIVDQVMLRGSCHEFGHAVGLDLDHSFLTAGIEAKLAKTPGGLFCSVMPYTEYVSSATSRCGSASEQPNYAVFPSTLDRRMIELLYKDPLPFCFSSFCFSNYVMNAVDASFYALIFHVMFQNLSRFFRSLEKEQKPLN